MSAEEAAGRRYPKRGMKAESPLPPPVPKKRRAGSPQTPAAEKKVKARVVVKAEPVTPVQSNGNGAVELSSDHHLCERTDPACCSSSVFGLPPSAASFKDVPAAAVGDLFAVYSYLRCFSRLLFLSPFSLEKFVSALCADSGDALMDSVHVSLLEAVKRHALSSESSSSFFGDLNWELLDLVTWPVFLRSFLRTQGYSAGRKQSLVESGIGAGEYQKSVPVAEKLAMLSFLCDRAIQNEENRKEVSVRLMAAHEALVEYTTTQRAGEDDSDFKPGETPLLRKVSDKLLKDTEKGEWSKEVQRAATALGGDGNSNDCMICGMDGVLICCDACPAAYHSRCVGVTKAKLGQGDWFCPECRLPFTGIPYAKRLLGAVILGYGPKGRSYMATCDHLLVAEVGKEETKYWYYGVPELPSVFKYLQNADHGYYELQHSIRRHWNTELVAFLENRSREELAASKGTPISTPPRARGSEKKRKLESSLEEDSVPKKTPRSEGKPKTPRTPKVQVNPGPYVNNYAHGDAVATAADTLAAWQGGGDPAWVPGTRARGTGANEQVKAFTVSLPTFAWPSNRKLFSEKCGWCGLCSSNTRGCLLVQTHLQISRHVDELRPLKISKGPRHLGTIAAYVLHLEEILHPLLEGGDWENPLQRQRWRTRLEKSPSVSVFRKALLQLEASLRPIAISTDWVKHPDIAPMLWPSCMQRKEAPVILATTNRKLPLFRERVVQWWRGGKVARLLCDWERLPRETLKKSARKALKRRTAIPGLLYNDTNAVPQRSKQCAWRARVESASSVAEIGLQVRYFDLQLKWKELLVEMGENETPYIYEKTKEDAVTKYLVAVTEENGNEKGNKDPQPSDIIISAEGVKQVWKPEQQVPLSQVKLYEKYFGEKIKKGTPGKKKKPASKANAGSPSKKRALSVVVDKLKEQIRAEEKKLEASATAKKLQAGKSPSKIVADKKPEKSEPVVLRRQCNRCSADGDKVELSTVDGMLVCGQCHGKRPRKLSAKALAALTSEEAVKEEEEEEEEEKEEDEEDELETEVENGPVFAKQETPPPRLEWSGTSHRKSGRKRKRVNLDAGSFAWADKYDGPADPMTNLDA